VASGQVSSNLPGRLGPFVLRFRAPIGILLLAISALAFYYASTVKIATNFVDFFPSNHPYVKLYEKWHKYGGAQTLAVMVEVNHGDIYNYDTLKKIQELQAAVNKLPGVNHNEVLSLASYRISYARTAPGALIIRPYMFPHVPKTKAGIEALQRHVFTNRASVSYLVSPDDKAAVVVASFNERGLNYWDLFQQVQKFVKNYQDKNNRIYVVGEPIVRGYGYYYEPVVNMLLLIAVGVMIVFLFIALGGRSRWWVPIVTGSLSALWGLGFIGLMGWEFDPVMLVIPFILTARDLSHGIQWQGRYHDELDRLGDKFAAIAATTDRMLPPGLLSILADISGIIFISLGHIPVLHHIALGGSVWLAGSITMVFIFQPIFMSYLPAPRIKHTEKRAQGALTTWAAGQLDRLVHVPVNRGAVRNTLMVLAGGFLVYGIVAGVRCKIGYSSIGTPLYTAHSKVNRDIAAVGRKFPLEEGWVILTTPQYPSDQCAIAPKVLRLEDDFRTYMMRDPRVAAVVSFSNMVTKPFNQMFHYGHPKYFATPSSLEMSGNLWFLYLNGTAPGELERFISNRSNTDTCIRVLLKDHTYDTLNGVRSRIKAFVADRLTKDPALSQVKAHYLAGMAGLYLAANDVLYKLDFINITFVLLVIFLFCVVTYRSFVAGLLFILSCVLANFGAFIYMNLRGIGLTIDTIPVVSLGIGLGVDYGIYTISRVRDEVMAGMSVDDAIVTALKHTGSAVFHTFTVMVSGIVPWVFSPILFHNQMSLLLIVLMATNMIAGVIILPSFVSWRPPKFIFGGRGGAAPATERVVASSARK
jgi:uncharacterized protein